MRSGCLLRVGVERPLDLLALVGLRRRAVVDLRCARRPGRSPAMAASSCWSQVAQRVLVLGEDQDAACRSTGGARAVSGAAGPGTCAPDPVEQAADAGVGQAAGRLGDLASSRRAARALRVERSASAAAGGAAVAASNWAPPSAAAPPRSASARSSSLPTPPREQIEQPSAAASGAGSAACSAAAARRCGGGRASVRANASTDDSSRCCRPEIEQRRGGLLALRLALQPLLAQLAVLVEQRGQPQLRGVGGQAVDVDLLDDCRSGKPPCDRADVLLEPADHDVVEELRALDRHAAAEPLRVEDLQQGREAVGVAVVRRGRQEQPVLEPRGQVADGAGDLRVDGVARAAGRGGVVRLVEDQQRAGPEVAEPVAQRRRRTPRRSAAGARRGSGCASSRG